MHSSFPLTVLKSIRKARDDVRAVLGSADLDAEIIQNASKAIERMKRAATAFVAGSAVFCKQFSEFADSVRGLYPTSQPLSPALAELVPNPWPWSEEEGDAVCHDVVC